MKTILLVPLLFLLRFSHYNQNDILIKKNECHTKIDSIDYNNFNSDLATKALAQAYLNFKDTADTFTSGEKFSSYTTEILTNPELKKARWSDWVYKTFSKPNTEIMSKDPQNGFYHVDVEKKFLSDENLIRREYYRGVKNVPKIMLKSRFLGYKENIYRTERNFETYQDLANSIIKCWDKSYLHSCVLRSICHDITCYKEYGIKVQNIFACCVMYNPKTKCTKACINFIG
jgi:hypothetical protein